MKDYVTHVKKTYDEIHFLIECDKYKDEIQIYSRRSPKLWVNTGQQDEIYIPYFWHKKMKILYLIASCTHDWFKIRYKPIVGTWDDIKNCHLSFEINEWIPHKV